MKKRFIRGVVCLILTSLFVAGPAFSGDTGNDTKDKTDQMTKQDLYRMIQDLQKEVSRLKEQLSDPGKHLGGEGVRELVHTEVAAMKARDERVMDRVEIHASLAQGFLYSDHNNWSGDSSDGMLDYNEFTVNFSSSLTDRLRAGIQLMSRDMGDFVNNEIRVDWANMDYTWQDELGFRAGILKIPFGLYNESRDIDSARIGVLLPQGFYSENIREMTNDLLGVSLYGTLDLNMLGTLSYSLLYGGNDADSDGEIAMAFSTTGLMDEDSITTVRIDDVLAGALTWQTPLEGLNLNLNYQVGKLEINGAKTIEFPPGSGNTITPSASVMDKSFSNIAAGVEYTWGNLVLAAEYRVARLSYHYSLHSGDTTLYDQQMDEIKPAGWYVLGSYRFTDWFAAEASYSEYWTDQNDKKGETLNASGVPIGLYGYQNTLSFNARFDINDYWIIKAGVNFNEGFGTGYSFQQDDELEKHWILYQLKTSISF